MRPKGHPTTVARILEAAGHKGPIPEKGVRFSVVNRTGGNSLRSVLMGELPRGTPLVATLKAPTEGNRVQDYTISIRDKKNMDEAIYFIDNLPLRRFNPNTGMIHTFTNNARRQGKHGPSLQIA